MRGALLLVFLPIFLTAAPLVIIDPGHGGYDLGASVQSTYEKSLTLSTAMLVKKYLSQKGYKVIMTRTKDVYLSLKERAEIANKTRGKLFVSVHFNADKNLAASGIEVFYYNGTNKWRTRCSKKLAECALSSLLSETKAPSRGVKAGNFHVIRETEMPAVLIEAGFITHSQERGHLKDLRYRDKLAKAISKGIEEYFKVALGAN
jgi:N-acetylmuramoyl-L-alanine amidase